MPALTMRSAPSGPKIHVKNYSLFRGVDFSSDPSKVDDRRSPWAPNLISDAGGFPEKRLGWRTVHTFDGPVHGIFFFKYFFRLLLSCGKYRKPALNQGFSKAWGSSFKQKRPTFSKNKDQVKTRTEARFHTKTRSRLQRGAGLLHSDWHIDIQNLRKNRAQYKSKGLRGRFFACEKYSRPLLL